LPGALEGIRVIDLTNERGVYCGKVLGDLGADVIRVEPPEGDALRSYPPFRQGVQDPNQSLYFWHHNTNKRSLVLDLRSQVGRDALLKLAAGADIVVDSFDPSYLESLGLGYEELSERFPRLIYASITPFGRSGPLNVQPANNIVLCALSGAMNVNGDLDLAPLAAFEDQSYLAASNYAAATALAAVYYRGRSGRGQLIDVSIEAAIASFVHWPYLQSGVVPMRTGALNLNAFGIVRCLDGYCAVSLNHNWDSHLSWMLSDGFGEELVGLPPPLQTRDPVARRANLEKRLEVVGAWAATKPVDQLFVEGQEAHRLTFGKIMSVDDVFTNPQLRARGFMVPVEHPELGPTFEYPGAPYRLSRTPWAIRRRPPLPGEHNQELDQELDLGLSPAQSVTTSARGQS
jgi:benzylsuccinate CoA-transferase BbsE subunit